MQPCCCCCVASVVSDSVRPHRRQPTRLSPPGKNTGVGCHFLLQCMKVKSESEVAQSCPTLRDPVDCSPPGSSVHGIFQARGLEWGAALGIVLTCSDSAMKQTATVKNVASNYWELSIGTWRTECVTWGKTLVSQSNFRFCPLNNQGNTT